MRLAVASCLIGVLLLTLNVCGCFLSLRAPLADPRNDAAVHHTLSWREFQDGTARRADETDLQYVRRINGLVHRGILHYWSDEDVGEYHLTVPVWENYLLYLGSVIKPDVFRKYEFTDWRKAAERGVGLCSQQAIVMAGILLRSGTSNEIVSLDGHVVVRARVDEKTWYVCDPDYGVVIPHDIRTIEADPSLVRSFYAGVAVPGGGDPESVPSEMARLYGPEGNMIASDVRQYYPKRFYIEKAAYAAKWAVPVLLCGPFLILLLRRKRSADGKRRRCCVCASAEVG